MSKTNEAFAHAVKQVMAEKGLSLRAVEYKTGIDHTTVLGMVNGRIPKKGTIIDFAQGLGENINHWLALAGYDPIPEELVCEHPTEEDPLRGVTIALNGAKSLSDLSKQRIIEIVKQELEKSKKTE